MTIQVAIIGTGQIGASFGLALAGKKESLVRVGHDKETKIAQKAEKLGAVDRVESNLPRSVREAELVLLSIPMDQIRGTIEIIAPNLKEGAVVMETGLAKEAAAAWAREFLPPDRYFVGLTPVLNPAFLNETGTGIDAARADLFKNGLMGITAPATTHSGAIKLAVDLTRLVEAYPLFADPAEIDGLMSSTHLLPQVMAAALLNMTIDQPGWMEARKVTGRMFTKASEPAALYSDAAAVGEAVILNRDNLLRVIDNLIASLYEFRGSIEESNRDGLLELLERARINRRTWWGERLRSEWAYNSASRVEIPENPGLMSRLIGLGSKQKK